MVAAQTVNSLSTDYNEPMDVVNIIVIIYYY